MSARDVYADREAARRDRVNSRKNARARKEELSRKFGGKLDNKRRSA